MKAINACDMITIIANYAINNYNNKVSKEVNVQRAFNWYCRMNNIPLNTTCFFETNGVSDIGYIRYHVAVDIDNYFWGVRLLKFNKQYQTKPAKRFSIQSIFEVIRSLF